MKKIKVCWLLIVCLLLELSYPSFLLAEETTTTFAAELTGDQLYEQGLNFYKEEKYLFAIPYFEEAGKRKSNFAETYYQLGMCYMETKQFDKASQPLIMARVLTQDKNLRDKANSLIARIPKEIEKEKKAKEDELSEKEYKEYQAKREAEAEEKQRQAKERKLVEEQRREIANNANNQQYQREMGSVAGESEIERYQRFVNDMFGPNPSRAAQRFRQRALGGY